MNNIKRIVMLTLLLFVIVSCSSSPKELPMAATTTSIPNPTAIPEPAPDSEIGKKIFNTKYLETSGNSCHDCHKLNDAIDAAGVNLAGVATRAGMRIEGMSAEDYLRQSILEPRAYLVEGYDPERMPTIFGEILSEEELNHLIAYLMTLE
jgi:mono/diheme cytochrome c family protein